MRVSNNQNGVLLIGVVEGNELKRRHPHFDKIAAGQSKTIIYRYFVNSEFKEVQGDARLKFTIDVTESREQFGFSEVKTIGINTTLKEEGKIRQVQIDDN